MRASNFKERVTESLRRVNRELGTTLGVVARIDQDNYELIAVDSNSGAFVAGERYALGNCYCREVCDEGRLIARTGNETAPLDRHHPMYHSLPLECYIGAPIAIGDKVWGCVNFSSMAQREDSFNADEEELVAAVAERIARLVAKLDA